MMTCLSGTLAPKGEKRSGLTESVHYCTIVLLYKCRCRTIRLLVLQPGVGRDGRPDLQRLRRTSNTQASANSNTQVPSSNRLKLDPDGPPHNAADFAPCRFRLRTTYPEVIYGGGFDSVPRRFTALNLTRTAGVRHRERSETESKGDGRTEARGPVPKLQVAKREP